MVRLWKHWFFLSLKRKEKFTQSSSTFYKKNNNIDQNLYKSWKPLRKKHFLTISYPFCILYFAYHLGQKWPVLVFLTCFLYYLLPFCLNSRIARCGFNRPMKINIHPIAIYFYLKCAIQNRTFSAKLSTSFVYKLGLFTLFTKQW